MKLTKELKREIDTFSKHKIVTFFRFHPCDYTTGETGRYMQQKVRELVEKESPCGPSKKAGNTG